MPGVTGKQKSGRKGNSPPLCGGKAPSDLLTLDAWDRKDLLLRDILDPKRTESNDLLETLERFRF